MTGINVDESRFPEWTMKGNQLARCLVEKQLKVDLSDGPGIKGLGVMVSESSLSNNVGGHYKWRSYDRLFLYNPENPREIYFPLIRDIRKIESEGTVVYENGDWTPEAYNF